jgi:hypothetical protein
MSEFMFDENRTNDLKEVNIRIGIKDDLSVEKNKTLIFVYCPPKVGSTTVVSSLRLSASNKITVIHLHNDVMLKVLFNITNTTVNEIIHFNKFLGKNVYVFDIYRTPVEHKMSSFFENIDTFHFNTSIENLKTYSIDRVIKRFNYLFPYLVTCDYYRETYHIPVEKTEFDFEKKYLLTEHNGITYVKLRLKDSHQWGHIFKEILQMDIYVVSDYETDSKNTNIKEVYKHFKTNYKIPKNFIDTIKNSPQFLFYNDIHERNEYLKTWEDKSVSDEFTPFNPEEYEFYNKISMDNHHMNEIQDQHYIDCGCSCIACDRKRNILLEKAKRGEKINDKIIHGKSKTEYLIEKIKKNTFTKTISNTFGNSFTILKKSNKPRKIIRNNFMVQHHL